LRHLQFVLSVSETHNRENAGRSVEQSLDELAAIRERTPYSPWSSVHSRSLSPTR
jgi:hypothetical protein